MFDQAWTLDSGQRSSELYSVPLGSSFSATASEPKSAIEDSPDWLSVSAAASSKCFFCGYSKHPCSRCPAHEATCNKCQKKGHFVKVCHSSPASSVSGARTASVSHPTLASVTSAATPPVLSKAASKVFINRIEADNLIDSGSTDSFIHPELVG